MTVITRTPKSSITPSLRALTPLNLYLERVKSVTDALRASAVNQDYIPLQFGGISGQQQSLIANSVVKIVDFNIQDN